MKFLLLLHRPNWSNVKSEISIKTEINSKIYVSVSSSSVSLTRTLDLILQLEILNTWPLYSAGEIEDVRAGILTPSGSPVLHNGHLFSVLVIWRKRERSWQVQHYFYAWDTIVYKYFNTEMRCVPGWHCSQSDFNFGIATDNFLGPLIPRALDSCT